MSKRGQRKEKLQQNFLLKGRGQGSGINYTPFIQAHDNKIASEGWLTRHKGWKTSRIHHTLSEHERKYLYYCEWLDGVIDIREQWPLLPIEKTMEIAEQLGIRHPNLDGTPVVMTTDFRLTLKTCQQQLNFPHYQHLNIPHLRVYIHSPRGGNFKKIIPALPFLRPVPA